MRVKVPLPAFPVVHVLAVFRQETPARLRPARDEDLRGDIDHRVSAIPLDVTRFVRVRTAHPDAHAEVDQQDRSQAASLRTMARAHANKAMIAAGQGLRVHADGRVVVGQAIEFLGPGPVGIHGPDALGDPSALVDILPAVIHDPAVIEDHRAEFADRAIGELFDVGAVGVHAVQTGGHKLGGPAAEDRVFAAGRGEDDLAVRQIAGVDVVRVPALAPPRRLLRLVGRREGDLTQARAVGVYFPDAESGRGILAEIEDDLLGVRATG